MFITYLIKRGFLPLLLLCSVPSWAQQISLYSSQDGLPNSKINRVYQDPGGTVWVATQNGLSYFDGMRFTTFRHDDNRPGSLNNNLVTAIYTDSRGTCWIGTSVGVQIFDPEYHTFTDFRLGNAKSYFISSIGEMPDRNQVVIATSGTGFRVIDMDTHEQDTVTTDLLNRLIRGQFSGKTLIDSKGIMWMYSEQGLCRVDPAEEKSDSRLWGSARERVPAGIGVSVVREEPRSGKVLIGTFNHGIFIYDPALGYVRPASGGASSHRVRDILVLANEESTDDPQVWIGTEELGIRRFDLSDERIEEVDIRRSPIDPAQGKVHTLMQDLQGNIWAGFFQKGLMVIPRSVYGFDYYAFTADGKPRGENLACVTSVVRDLSGTLWVGTDGGGLFRLDEEGNTQRFTRHNTPLHNNSIMSLTLDKRGKLWISTYMGGISTYTPQEGFRRYSSDPDLRKAVHSVYDSVEDQIYYGTHGSGVMRISPQDNRAERFPPNAAGYVNDIFLDSSRRLWISTGTSLRCYDPVSGVADTTQVFRWDNLGHIKEGSDGMIWLGSSDGLVCYDPATKTHAIYTLEDGLPNNMIYSIEEDGDGVLWLGTGYGLSRFDPKEGVFRNFFIYDGLQDNEFQNGASYKDPDGKLFFGGIGGLSAFYPARVAEGVQELGAIRFSRLAVLGQTVDYTEQTGRHRILDHPIDQARQITLKKSQNLFSIDFSVLEYANPQKIRYGYRMVGFDQGWRYADASQRSATYTNLPEGRYRFQVKAFYDGDPDESRAVYNEINIRILPPWYKTWWIRLVYAALFAVVVWLFIGFLRRRQARVRERLEMERKEMKLQLFTDMSHEIRTPLTLVMTPLKAMWEDEEENKRRNIYNLMYRNARRILTIIDQLIDMNRVGNPHFQLRFHRTDMIFFLRDIVGAFEQPAVMRNIDCRIVSNRDSLETWIDQRHFDKVVFNILSNAFKFTPDNGSVLITLETYLNSRQSGLPAGASRYLEMRFENSGSYIPPEDLERIFERFHQSDGNTPGGSGIGLHLAKRITELHYGTLKAENTEDGVVFILRIPLGDAHLSAEQKAATPEYKDLYGKIRPDGPEYLEAPAAGDEAEMEEIPVQSPPKTIYFVDDDPELLKYISLELSDEYRIKTFLNIDEAWAGILTNIPDAVVTDLVFPDADGMALCRKIRENRKTDHLPVIILTGETKEETEYRSLESGADRYLTKPVSLGLLKGTIAQAIRVRETLWNKYRIDVSADEAEAEVSSPDSRFVARVIECIRRNIENPGFSVDELSREVGISRVHLNRKLKENIDTSPSNLIRSIRLRQAAYLLVRHNIYISEAAYRVGFSSPTSFSNSFKDYFGMSPTEYVSKNTANRSPDKDLDIA